MKFAAVLASLTAVALGSNLRRRAAIHRANDISNRQVYGEQGPLLREADTTPSRPPIYVVVDRQGYLRCPSVSVHVLAHPDQHLLVRLANSSYLSTN